MMTDGALSKGGLLECLGPDVGTLEYALIVSGMGNDGGVAAAAAVHARQEGVVPPQLLPWLVGSHRRQDP